MWLNCSRKWIVDRKRIVKKTDQPNFFPTIHFQSTIYFQLQFTWTWFGSKYGKVYAQMNKTLFFIPIWHIQIPGSALSQQSFIFINYNMQMIIFFVKCTYKIYAKPFLVIMFQSFSFLCVRIFFKLSSLQKKDINNSKPSDMRKFYIQSSLG